MAMRTVIYPFPIIIDSIKHEGDFYHAGEEKSRQGIESAGGFLSGGAWFRNSCSKTRQED
jgi:hypothetical protein